MSDESHELTVISHKSSPAIETVVAVVDSDPEKTELQNSSLTTKDGKLLCGNLTNLNGIMS